MADMRNALTAPPGTTYTIDYDNSTIKGKAALIYLTNINLPNVKFKSDNIDELCKLICDYMNHKSVIEIPCLVSSMGVLLMDVIGALNLDDPEIAGMLDDSVLTAVSIERFYASPERIETLVRLATILANIPTMLEHEAKAEEELTVDVVDNLDYIGYTFVHLLKMNLVMIQFMASGILSQVHPTFFRQHYKDYMYGGKNLYAYLAGSIILPIAAAFRNKEEWIMAHVKDA